MADILDKIIADKRQHVERARSRVSEAELNERIAAQLPARGFYSALSNAVDDGQVAVIAEVKKASPSKGLIREDFDPAVIAACYERGGAACISVLTDEPYFQGHDDFLVSARNACALPALRKDFMIDPYQIMESRALGADCILLIVSALNDSELRQFADFAADLGMDVLIEVHDANELERALAIGDRPGFILGINNRNLRTFETTLETTVSLLKKIPDNRLVVSESGIHHPDDVRFICEAGVQTFLVGESLMRQEDPAAALEQLVSAWGATTPETAIQH